MRWDSLGEFLALAESFAHLARTRDNKRAQVLAETLDRPRANSWKTASHPVGCWASWITSAATCTKPCIGHRNSPRKTDDPALQQKFAPVAKELEANIEKILEELKATKGKPMDVGGYYHPDPVKVEAAMRPSATFNNILATLG